MNHKILHKLENMIHVSPQLIRNTETMRQAIRGTFAVDVQDVEFNTIGELVDRIDDKVLDGYFRHVWQSETSKYKYSGPALIGEINQLKPRRVLDIGCGYNEFQGKIDNIIGIDPFSCLPLIYVLKHWITILKNVLMQCWHWVQLILDQRQRYLQN